jgi:RNA polymerase sigma-70 factor (ECF subfamily)
MLVSDLELDSPQGDADDDSAARTEAFIRLLGQSHRSLHLYVMSLVPNRSDAEDVLQQTQLVLWREFAQFELGTNFAAWACRVAFNQVLAWRKRRQRDRLVFSEAFLEAVAEEAAAGSEWLEDRSQRLAGCLNKLPPHHRELIRLRYTEGTAVETIATEVNRSVDAVYRMLSRIRQSLYDCVSRSLGQEGAV